MVYSYMDLDFSLTKLALLSKTEYANQWCSRIANQGKVLKLTLKNWSQMSWVQRKIILRRLGFAEKVQIDVLTDGDRDEISHILQGGLYDLFLQVKKMLSPDQNDSQRQNHDLMQSLSSFINILPVKFDNKKVSVKIRGAAGHDFVDAIVHHIQKHKPALVFDKLSVLSPEKAPMLLSQATAEFMITQVAHLDLQHYKAGEIVRYTNSVAWSALRSVRLVTKPHFNLVAQIVHTNLKVLESILMLSQEDQPVTFADILALNMTTSLKNVWIACDAVFDLNLSTDSGTMKVVENSNYEVIQVDSGIQTKLWTFKDVRNGNLLRIITETQKVA